MTERLSDDGLRDILSDDDAWPSCAEAHEMARELVELRALCGEVYQVVGVLAHQADVFSTPEVERAMNNLVAALNGLPLPHETLLPFGVKSAGPVMPEVPSDDVLLSGLYAFWERQEHGNGEAFGKSEIADMGRALSAIRAELLKEQA